MAIIELNILQISAFFPAHGGGIERVASHLAKGITSAGVGLTWMAGGSAAEIPSKSDLPKNLIIQHAASFDILERWIGLPAPIWAPASLRRMFREVRHADLVHIHDYLYLANIFAIIAARLYKKPVIITQHIGEIPFNSLIPRLLLKILNRTIGALTLLACHKVVFVATPVFRYFQSYRVKNPDSLVISNGVDHSVFYPNPAHERKTSNNNRFRVLFVGRYVEKKGIHLLHQAVEELMDIDWDFVGSGPLSPEKWALSKSAQSRVNLHKNLSPEQLAEKYRSADLLVLPSTGEGFPLVVQEALACGTPVMLSQEVSEAMEAQDPRCIHSVELRNMPRQEASAVLSQALARLVQSWREQDCQTHQQARQAAVMLASKWSWQSCTAAYLACYRELLDR